MIRIPEGVPIEQVVGTISRRLPWIVRATSRQARMAAEHVVKEVIDGENFPFLGRNRRLVLQDASKGDVCLVGDRLIAPLSPTGPSGEHIIRWYSGEGLVWLRERVPQWCSRVGSPRPALEVRDLGRRWGTCATGMPPQIALHWALFQLAPHLIDVVVVHELAHLVEPRHGQTFDHLVGRVIPGYSDRLAELAETGRRIWMGAIAPGC
jgi:predicted metal-dependent hydrolase